MRAKKYVKRRDHCAIKGCERPYYTARYCSMHYARKLAYGHPLRGGTFRGEPAKFLHDHFEYDGDDCVIWPYARSLDGYANGSFKHDGVRMNLFAYLMLMTKGPRPTPTHQAAHSCGNGRGGCINPKHLRWATPKENNLDKEMHGTALRGERAVKAKLSEADVRAIRAAPATIGHTALARQYAVGPTAIRSIRSYKTWRSVA